MIWYFELKYYNSVFVGDMRPYTTRRNTELVVGMKKKILSMARILIKFYIIHNEQRGKNNVRLGISYARRR